MSPVAHVADARVDDARQAQSPRDWTAAERLESLVMSSDDAIIGNRLDGTIVSWNPGAERLYGYGADEAIGRPITLLTPPASADELAGLMARIARGERVEHCESMRRHQDGRLLEVSTTIWPIRGADGCVNGVSTIARDISERKPALENEQSERELSEANIALESANRAKDRFLASMSHELRTPLNAILGFTGTMLMRLPGPLTADQEHQLLVVRTNGRHLLSLINDLLDLARIESGEIPLTVETIGSEGLLGEVVASLQPLADAKDLQLSLTVPEAWPDVQSDRRGLRQILTNLANNAIKFTDAGRVCLAVGRDRERAVTVFSVADTGRGIVASDQALLFAAFQQVGDTDRDQDEGTGLGLYICKSLATALGASISFESEFGSGSTFSVELPD